jgi:hypothetical protein
VIYASDRETGDEGENDVNTYDKKIKDDELLKPIIVVKARIVGYELVVCILCGTVVFELPLLENLLHKSFYY